MVDFFGNQFTAHSIPRIASSRGVVRKVVWGIISIVLVVTLGIQIADVLNQFNSFPKQVTVEIQDAGDVNGEVKFPAVTVCNFNVAELSKLQQSEFSNVVNMEEQTETAGRKKRQAQTTGDSDQQEEEKEVTEYKGYKKMFDSRSMSYRWCRSEEDCLETLG
ncbi:hypothetical protein Pcinc_035382 [Petrolisthes cinctipes]|uniref:Uncharacterized protein n=1 Tax=Petrolisthes cinctipes TaxID=88211 RepID=A0AAE1EPV8_PETCI|nr:hypothetical protein Pcinc_035382 [Petrolisthes cinctipes]